MKPRPRRSPTQGSSVTKHQSHKAKAMYLTLKAKYKHLDTARAEPSDNNTVTIHESVLHIVNFK